MRFFLAYMFPIAFVCIPVPAAAVDGEDEQALPPTLYVFLEVNPDGDLGITVTTTGMAPPSEAWLPVLEKTVGGSLTWVEYYGGEEESDGMAIAHLSAWREEPLDHDCLNFVGSVDVRPLASSGLVPPDANCNLLIEHPDNLQGQLEDSTWVSSEEGWTTHAFVWGPGDPLPQGPLAFRYGHRPAHVASAFALPFALLLLTLVLLYALRRRALRATGDRTLVWFEYWRYRAGLLLLFWIFWPYFVFTFGLVEYVEFLSAPSDLLRLAASTAVVILPPVLVNLFSAYISYPVVAGIRGMTYTRRELVTQAAAVSSAIAVGLALILVMVNGMDFLGLRGMLVTWGVCVALVTILIRLWYASFGFRPSALSTGELRDRIFAMASAAHVKVNQVFLLQTEKMQLSNAAAIRGGNVVLTDFLVNRLSKPEVDAIVAHEIAHLRYNHPSLLGVTATLIGAPLGVALTMGLGTMAWLGPILVLGGVMVYTAVSRSFERTADAFAVRLCGNPEALISGLAKITRQGLLPLSWTRWTQPLLTHPSTFERAKRIAEKAGISPERTQALLDDDSLPSTRYEFLPSIAGQDRVFNTQYKTRYLSRAFWQLFATVVLTPSVVGFVTLHTGLTGWSLTTAYIGGICLTILLMLYVMAKPRFSPLVRELHARFRSEGLDIHALEGVPVGFAPGHEQRLYENFSFWDVGFLFLQGDRLSYVGENARFAIPRESITEVTVAPGMPGWLRMRKVYVTWLDESAPQTFNLFPLTRHWGFASKRQAQAIADRILRWQNGTGAELPAPLPELQPPQFGEITSSSPAEFGRGVAVRTSMLVIILAALIVAIALRLPFMPWTTVQGWYALITSVALGGAYYLPFILYRRSRNPFDSQPSRVADSPPSAPGT